MYIAISCHALIYRMYIIHFSCLKCWHKMRNEHSTIILFLPSGWGWFRESEECLQPVWVTRQLPPLWQEHEWPHQPGSKETEWAEGPKTAWWLGLCSCRAQEKLHDASHSLEGLLTALIASVCLFIIGSWGLLVQFILLSKGCMAVDQFVMLRSRMTLLPAILFVFR